MTQPSAAGTADFKDELNGAMKTSVQLGLSLACTWTVALLVRFLVPRYLGPAQFGDLNFAESFASGFMVFASLGIDTYTMREVAVRPAHASDYFAGVHVVRGVMLVLLIALMALVLARHGKSTEMQLTVVCWAVAQALVQVNGTLGTLLQAVARARWLAIANVIGKLAWGAGLLSLLMFRTRLAPLWAYALPALAAELLKVVLTLPAAREAVGLRLQIDTAATRRVVLTSLPFLVSTLAFSLGGPLNFWVLDNLKTDARELGWYGATLNLSSLAMLFSPLLNWVLLPMLSRAGARSREEVDRIVGYALEAFLLGVIPVVLMACLGAELWVQLAFGQAYAPAAMSLRIMAVMIVFTYAAMIISNGLVAQGFSWSLSWLSLTSVLLAPLLASVLVPRIGRVLGSGGEAAGAAIAVTLAEVIAAALAVARMGRHVTPPRFVRAIAKACLACAVVTACDRALSVLGHARLAVDLALYVLLALALRVVDVRELRGMAALIRRQRSGA